jgi:hypothetical protein
MTTKPTLSTQADLSASQTAGAPSNFRLGDTSGVVGTSIPAGMVGETVSVTIPSHTGSNSINTETSAVSLVIPSAGTWDIFCDFQRALQLSSLSGGLGCLVDTFIYNGSTLIRQHRYTISTGITNCLFNTQLTSLNYATTGSTTLTLKISVGKWAGPETVSISASGNTIGPSNVTGNGFYAVRRI